jgi:hypothetical protein
VDYAFARIEPTNVKRFSGRPYDRRTVLVTVVAAGAFGLVLRAAPGDAQTATE